MESGKRRQRYVRAAVLVAVGAVITGGAAVGGGGEAGGPSTPGELRPQGGLQDGLVLARVPAGRRPRSPAAGGVGRSPLAVATREARAHLDEARRTGDPRSLGHAEAALAGWWHDQAPPAEVLVLKATVRQSRHDFDGALADLDRALALRPDDPQAWLTRATVLTVRGRYREALEGCARLAALLPAGAVAAAACAAPPAAVTGRGQQARAALEGALAGQAATLPERAWAHSLLGELEDWAGRPARAERHFREALRLDPDDRYGRAAYADLLLDAGRASEVGALIGARGEDDDALLLRLVLAGSTPEIVARLRARHAGARARGPALHQREEARFALAIDGDPARALILARAAWAAQREPWDARVLLESALAAGDPAAAAPVLAWLRDNGIEHRRLQALAARVAAATTRRGQ